MGLVLLQRLVTFTFLIDTNNQLNSGERLATWKVTPVPIDSSGEEQVTCHRRHFLRSTSTPPPQKEDETHTIPSQESEENQSDTQYETAPNSPLWETDQIDLLENWLHNGTDEEKFDTINQYEQWVKEDQVA